MSEADRTQLFTVYSDRSLDPLRVWLSDRSYNNVFPYLRDVRGRRMIGLNQRHSDGTYDKCGLIVIDDLDYLDQVLVICDEARDT